MTETGILPARTKAEHAVAPRKRDSLPAWFNLYMGLEAGANADNTIRAKTRDLSAFLDFFTQATGSDHPDQWTRCITGDFVKKLQRAKRSPTTVNRVLATLRHCARWIHHRRPFLAGNPTERIADITVDDPEWKGLTDIEVTKDGVRFFRSWVTRAQLPIGDPDEVARPSFPGFEAAFGIPWKPEPQFEVVIDEGELLRRVNYQNRHHRVYKAVELYEEAILNIHATEETPVDLWFVVVPDEVHRNCRPQSSLESATRLDSTEGLTKTDVKFAAQGQMHLFQNELAKELSRAYDFEVNFHNQLKARLLGRQIVTQIVRESTIAHKEVLGASGQPLRDLSKLQQDIAWHIATATFYKAGGRPWKISGMREGVCYLGIVFKHVDLSDDPHMAPYGRRRHRLPCPQAHVHHQPGAWRRASQACPGPRPPQRHQPHHVALLAHGTGRASQSAGQSARHKNRREPTT